MEKRWFCPRCLVYGLHQGKTLIGVICWSCGRRGVRDGVPHITNSGHGHRLEDLSEALTATETAVGVSANLED